MPAAKDLTGQIFGRLSVLSKDIELSKQKGRSYFNCQCECGAIVSIRGCDLSYGSKTACPECSKRNYIHDNLVGKKFGQLTVLEDTGKRNKRAIIYKCKCDCGNTCETTSLLLRNNHTKSCGCLTESVGELNIKQILDKNNIQYIQQYRFSDLPLLRFDFAIFQDEKLFALIEFDGIQHYDITNGWHTSQLATNDMLKNKYCLEHNYTLIRIPYDKRNNITLEDIIGNTYKVCKENHYNL